MITAAPATTPQGTAEWTWSIRRIFSLARAEALLLRRSPMALLNALAGPVVIVTMVRFSLPPDLPAEVNVGAAIVASLIGAALLLPVYYNLVTVLVARREDLVLKRLRTGETSDAEILTGAATPAVAIAWAQILIGVAVAVTIFGMEGPVNPALVLVAMVLGTAVFVLLAAVSTAMTRTVEMAQLTTMPVLLPTFILSGLFTPVDVFPESVQALARVFPLTLVIDLLHLGLTGTTTGGATVGLAASFGHAVPALLVLTAWVAIGAWATRRWFRWEPRR